MNNKHANNQQTNIANDTFELAIIDQVVQNKHILQGRSCGLPRQEASGMPPKVLQLLVQLELLACCVNLKYELHIMLVSLKKALLWRFKNHGRQVCGRSDSFTDLAALLVGYLDD